jgi:nicotinate-nucleotide pyrophosphorylase (carboxylating)
MEDIGSGVITNKLLFSRDKNIRAVIVTSEKGVACGLDVARMAFKLQDNRVRFTALVKDGARLKKRQVLSRIYGRASSILSSERVALNFLGLLSGIATRTAEFVKRVENYRIKIMDTRKTIPGLRQLQKDAVRVGGGHNHRFRLDEMVLIKDNHLVTSSVLRSATPVKYIIKDIKDKKPKNVKLEIEVKNLREFKESLKADPDIIMLDNMKIADIKRAVRINRNRQYAKHRTLLEASGNIKLKNIRAYAKTGVDAISLGTLTKDVRSLDLSLEIQEGG